MEQGTGRIEKADEEIIEPCKSYRICLPILNPGLITGKSMEEIHEEAGSINDEIKQELRINWLSSPPPLSRG